MEQAPVRPGDVLAGKYRVEHVLGAGGMGVVAAAWHMELEERVAIKFLLPGYLSEKEAGERFRREARAAVKIKSEHVARVLDVGTMEGDVPYMVMEYLEGRDLAAEIEASGPLSPEVATGFLLQACEAIAEAHSLGIVHRDLKPANLFLAHRPDGTRSVKVLDFGISKFVSGSQSARAALTGTQMTMGSPLYMSPEQLASAKDVDPRADIWSLGVILHEMLTGQPPFDGDTIPQVVRAVMAVARKPITELVGGPPELEEVIRHCLATDRERRFKDVSKLSYALLPFAPEQAAMSAARVSRVLNTDAPPPPAPSRTSSPKNPSRLSTPADVHSTKNAWSALDAQDENRRSKRALLLVAGGLVAVAGVATLLLTSRGEEAPTPMPSAEPAAAPELQPVVGPELAEEPVAPAPAPSADDQDSTGGAGGGGAPAVAASAPVRKPVVQPRVVSPRPVSKPAPKPTAKPTATQRPSDGLPDFGGRR